MTKEPSDNQDNEGDLVDNEGEHLAATQKSFVIRPRSWYIINFENSRGLSMNYVAQLLESTDENETVTVQCYITEPLTDRKVLKMYKHQEDVTVHQIVDKKLRHLQK